MITLDADTRLPRGSARRLIGKIAHPLNRPRLDPDSCRVVEGYAVLQPRVTPSLPSGREGSLFQRVFTSPSGLSPRTITCSPDNFQEEPQPVLAHRTSSTNLGLYLRSVVAACDFGWLGKIETAQRLESLAGIDDALEITRESLRGLPMIDGP